VIQANLTGDGKSQVKKAANSADGKPPFKLRDPTIYSLFGRVDVSACTMAGVVDVAGGGHVEKPRRVARILFSNTCLSKAWGYNFCISLGSFVFGLMLVYQFWRNKTSENESFPLLLYYEIDDI